MLYYPDIMTEGKISKKKLLRKTGISYGQFYRWKRKGLIPDNWLSHESTRTGQESFLPEKKIIPRIEKIRELKEDHTLKEIAELLSPELVEKKYDTSGLLELNWVDNRTVRAYEEVVGGRDFYSFEDLLNLTVFARLRESGIELKGVYLALKTLERREIDPNELEEKVILAKKKDKFLNNGKVEEDGTPYFCLLTTGDVRFDRTIIVETALDLHELVKEIKLELRDRDGQDQGDAYAD